MNLNHDFSQRVVINTAEQRWQPSPQAGVERIMLDRVGDEVARATSLVRYAPNSLFPEHSHGGGEEILVLDGVFSDEHGDYPAGSYLRNPPGSRHTPRSTPGCTLLVKLWQFAPDDQQQVRLDTSQATWQLGISDGLQVLTLHEHRGVSTALVRWQPGTRFSQHGHPGGEEIFVLQGCLADEDGSYPAGTWLRNPSASRHTPYSKEGALIYVKVGHLNAPTCWASRSV